MKDLYVFISHFVKGFPFFGPERKIAKLFGSSVITKSGRVSAFSFSFMIIGGSLDKRKHYVLLVTSLNISLDA